MTTSFETFDIATLTFVTPRENVWEGVLRQHDGYQYLRPPLRLREFGTRWNVPYQSFGR